MREFKLMIIALLVLLVSCVKEVPEDIEEPQNSGIVVQEPDDVLIDTSPVLELKPLTSEVIEGLYNVDVSKSYMTFSFDMFQRLKTNDGDVNMFMSPLSIINALAMTINGAGGDTYTEMMNALHFHELELETVNKGIASINSSVSTDSEHVQVSIANSIWARHDITLNHDYRESLKMYFDSESYQIDFTAPSAPEVVNEWVSENTNELIHEIINQFNGNELLLLINAIYFNAEWNMQFSEIHTAERDYHDIHGNIQSVDMMNQQHIWGLNYYKSEDYEAVKIPYFNNEYNMQIILPSSDKDYNEVISDITAETFSDLQSKYSLYQVDLSIPKFEIEYGARSVTEELMDMGMEKAFGNANFTLMFEDDNAFISDVLHKAVISVDEKGTEAAAVTVVVMLECAPPEREKADFVADRPFMFVISDKEGNIIFIGQKVE